MADTKISQLIATTSPTGSEELVFAYNSNNGKMTLDTMKNYVYGDYAIDTLTGSSITITDYVSTISTAVDISVSAGTSLTPGMRYTLRVENTDSADHTMTFGGQAYVVPEGGTVTFRFLALSTSSLYFQGPRLVSTMPLNPDEGEIYYVL